MSKKFWVFIVLTFVVIGGLVYYVGANPPGAAEIAKVENAKIEIPETKFSFGDIPFKGGLARHSFKIKNIGTSEITIGNLTTSCMCTKAYFQNGQEKSPEMVMGTRSAWTGKLAAGQEGEVVAIFDPAYHGPQGVGPISRVVSFETNDPAHSAVELIFDGNVVR
ncbi:MAG: hypothetical protein A2782_00480 [Candidatus Blackburnbacteria bacterium RIFCSPHIGHO2_01_FULL_43_15b]|uniref:DUF1573 domain-containing protein n=1 Tax=Candidatus Blackburnbacteria bacterium RIFCSPHIGHO2_01_FULL_43_15b TaxID=1797513 RepID=A0A1G1UYQ9_9BACT|nr:MAG: hypothetical protein A2782_00480 [Candidatus Blackburnbacteria bacterium RIFCSPHIGHO2_01_FULL_43_15b]